MTADPAPQTEETGFRLSPQQESLFRRFSGPTVPRLTLVLCLPSPVDADALAARWRRCVADLEILRTACRVPSWSRLPQQVVEDAVAADLAVETLSPDAVGARVSASTESPCDPAATPAVDARLLVAGDEIRLVLTGGAHVVDGDSLRLLAERLVSDAEPGEPLQYPDVAEWAASLAEDPDAATGLAFWRVRAEASRVAAAAFADRATDESRPRHIVSAPWPAAWAERAPTLAEIAALGAVFAARCAGGAAAPVAVRADGRDLDDLRGVVGPLARWLPIIAEAEPAAGFAPMSATAAEDLRRALEFQHLTEAGFGDAAPPRLAIGVALDEHADATPERLDPEPGAPPLVFRVEPSARRLTVLADALAFSNEDAARFGRMFATLADAASTAPQTPVARLDWLDAETRATLLSLGEGPVLAEAPSVAERVATIVAERGDAVAIVQGDTPVTYADLWRRSAFVAGAAPVATPDDERPVAVRLPRGPDALAAMIGAWRLGRPFTPWEPDLPQPRLAEMRAAVSPVAEITALPESAPDAPPSPVAGDLAYHLFTSGSTGTPKAVAITHSGLAASTAARTAHYSADPERFLVVSPFGFDSSVAGLWWTLATGGTVVLPTADEAEDAGALVRLIRDHGVTQTLMLPGLWDAVLDAAPLGALETLRVVIVAGEACPAALVERHRATLPHVRLENEYGPTEATVWCSAARLDTEEGGRVSIGRAIPGATVRVVDRELHPLPPGVPGEIVIGGAGLARGYVGRPGETAARFVPDPDATTPGARLYRVGDLGMLTPDGRILYRGRADNQVKLRGHRIELEEIEARLLAHPAVREAAAGVRDDRLVAWVVPREGTAPAEAEYASAVAALPERMRPQTWVTLPALPRGRTGKIDRAALPAPDARVASSASRPPRDATEAAVAAIWADLLKLENIGIDDDFFRLGGDSLIALRAATRMRRVGVDASPRLILKHPTIAALLDAALRIAPEAEPAPVATGAPVSAPPTPMQAWLLARAGGIPARYNQTLRARSRAPLDLALLERAFAAVVARHDALRLRFSKTPDGWRQSPGEAIVEPPLFFDLSKVPDAARAAIEASAWERLHSGLDPAAGRHARLSVIRRGGDAGDLLLAVVHHLAMDAASWRIAMEDLDTAYRELSAGRPVAWSEPAGSFTAFAAAIRALPPERLSGAFWERQSTIPVPPLPRDRTEGANREGDVATLAVELDQEATDVLAQRAPGALGHGLDAILTATLAEALGGWSGASTLRIDREHHGRADALVGLPTERTVGWFTTVHPVVLRLPDSTSAERLPTLLDDIARVPDDGFGWGLWAGAGADGEVLFNYLGRTDATTADDAGFTVEDGPTGRGRDPDLPRRCLFEIDAEILAGRLRVVWHYPATLYETATVERLAADHIARLAALAARLNTEEPA